MKRFTLCLLFVVSLNALYAQYNAFMIPDYGSIKKEIADTNSKYFYPKLLERYNSLDTTFTLNEFRRFYYGFVFQTNYQPYWTSPYQKELEKYYKTSRIDPKDYDAIIDLAAKSVKSFPFDIDNLYALSYLFHLKSDEATAKKYKTLAHLIFQTILSSGDGRTEESAFHVISVTHEYRVLQAFGYTSEQQSLIQGKSGACDYLELADNNEKVKGIYFNVEQLFKKNSEMFKNLN